MYHTAVLLTETVEGCVIDTEGVYVDATFGGGGHSAAFLAKLTGKGRLLSFDQDADAAGNAEQSPFGSNPAFQFVPSNFRYLKRQLRAYGVAPGTVTGIMADLGVSSFQLDTPERGFSYRFAANLDMRMNQQGEVTAADVLNTYPAERLQQMLSELGEVRNAKTLALACVRRREQGKFATTTDLVEVCDANMMGERWRYLSQVFQALRMEVNDELGALRDFLIDSLEALAPGGRLAIITFHSIEDRMVKNFMKTGNVEGTLQQDFYGNITKPFDLITKKPIEASKEEEKQNARARSAKLRIAVKKR